MESQENRMIVASPCDFGFTWYISVGCIFMVRMVWLHKGREKRLFQVQTVVLLLTFVRLTRGHDRHDLPAHAHSVTQVAHTAE